MLFFVSLHIVFIFSLVRVVLVVVVIVVLVDANNAKNGHARRLRGGLMASSCCNGNQWIVLTPHSAVAARDLSLIYTGTGV